MKKLFNPQFLSSLFRQFFQTISLRERILLSAIIWSLVLLWGSALMKDYASLRSAMATTGAALQDQKLWLDQKSELEGQLKVALQRLDPEKSFSSSRLTGKIDDLAREAELNFSLNSPVTEKGEIFDIHSVRIQIRKAGLTELVQFDRKIKRESPYLGLDRVEITADRRDPRFLDVQYVISSFELVEKIF